MPFAPHLRVTSSGTIGGTSGTGVGALEAFSFGLAMASINSVPVPDDPANVEVMEDIVTDISAFFARASTRLGSVAILQMVKIASIGADGKYTSDPYIGEIVVPGGGAGGIAYPPQVSLAVSLVTDRRGPSGQGRFFLPVPLHPLDATSLLVSDESRTLTQASAATLLNDLNNGPGLDSFPDLRVVVASSKGFNSPVTGVRVGRALDTIRSRRTSLNESYSDPTAVTG